MTLVSDSYLFIAFDKYFQVYLLASYCFLKKNISLGSAATLLRPTEVEPAMRRRTCCPLGPDHPNGDLVATCR